MKKKWTNKKINEWKKLPDNVNKSQTTKTEITVFISLFA